ncbi:hypothetical protein EXIGLDRAFT_829812 [Exidia glandulosa HHB12029]|uniref:Uncharacterized protein n=1 Tax=Exidia glandulosa HHB12029 TaxID=1314781 RepID=A0A166BKE5_EXIGL|nr:hypothetical protein EXIGLDRAFT_829812 [Exidia glandulosa HHB12029]
MKFSALAFTIAFVAASAPLASAIGATYILSNSNKTNYIVASIIGSDGKLSAGKATWAGGRGSASVPVGFDALLSQGAVLARGSNVFAVNAGSNTVSMFTKDASDPTKLTMVGGPVSSQGEFPQSIAQNPLNGDICVLNGGAVNSVACFTPDAELGLIAIPSTYREIGITQTTPPAGPPGTVTQVMFTVDGRRLVVSVKGVPPAPGFVAVWDVAANGSLSTGYSAITAPSGGVLPFGMSTLPHNPSVIVATDPAIGFDVFDLSGSLAMPNNGSTAILSSAARNVMASGVSSATVVPNSRVVCWSAFSPRTGNFYLIDPGMNMVTEVMVNSQTFKPTMVKQYEAGPAGGSVLDADVATVNGVDYLYVLAPNRTSIEVFSLRAVGQAQHIQTFDFTQSISDDVEIVLAVDLTAANRRTKVTGLPDWSQAGYERGQKSLPDDSQVGTTLSAADLASKYGVVPDDGKDDTDGLARAIADLSAVGKDGAFALIQLPAGTLELSTTVFLDANYLIIRGAGNDPQNGGTVLEFRPDNNTVYDVLTKQGDRWSQDDLFTEWSYADADGRSHSGSAPSGWLWPGRSVFRVGSKAIAPKFQEPSELAPKNRKDIFFGSVNYHWRNDTKVQGFMADQTKDIVGQAGTNKVYYDAQNNSWPWAAGNDVWIASPARYVDYASWAVQNQTYYRNQYMYQDWFTVQSASTDAEGSFLLLDHPLRFDVFSSSTANGSQIMNNKTMPAKVMPIEQPVTHVGIENLYITQVMPSNYSSADAVHNYGNMAPAMAMHGIVLRYARDCWVKGVRTFMTGSHPIATESARNIQVQDNLFDGAWNKGAGGNGYLRGSRVWDSLYFNNTLRNLRHFTFQWSSMGNVAIFNDMTNDFNLHGGFEGMNLIELNKINVPYEHRADSCKINCGGESDGDGPEGDESGTTWAPIYWSTGNKASAWSGASGPQNVFYRNNMTKAFKAGASEGDYTPYFKSDGSASSTVWQFGWDRASTTGSHYQQLSLDGTDPLPDWASHEQTAFQSDPAAGVNARLEDQCGSLFLKDASSITGMSSQDGCDKAIENSIDGKGAAGRLQLSASPFAPMLAALVLYVFFA